MKKQIELFEMLKGFYLEELVFIADTLSENRKKWPYDKRSKIIIRRAIVANTKEEDLSNLIMASLGKEMPSGGSFPSVIQVQKRV